VVSQLDWPVRQEITVPRIPRPIALALAGLVLTAALGGCGSSSPHPTQKDYDAGQLDRYEQQHIQNQIEQRDIDIRRAVRDELDRQRRP
jgi:hypothetical protein